MEVETDSAVAAVRGTVFGLDYDPSGKTTYSIADGKIDISNGTNLLVTLTGATEEYRSLDIQNNHTQPITEPIASFTGGTASGAAILNAIGGWDPNILSTRKPDITAISRSETGIILSLNAIEEDVGRKLCNGTASITIPETFTRPECQPIASGGNNTISFTNKELSTFAICTNDGATGNVGNCSASRTISLDSTSTFGLVSLDSKNLNCKAEDIFGPFGCLGKDTIAYAGFENGDLNMYTKSPDGSLIALPLITNASGSSYYTDFGRTTKSSGIGNIAFESGK